MIKGQQQFVMSKYSGLYDLLVPKKHFLRQLNELVDFSFVYDELLANYSLTTGRGAKDPILMFKYLLLKVIYELSDVDVVNRSLSDLSFKYFLNLAPEDTELIDPSSLTKFRKLRLKDIEMLDLLIEKTVEIAIKHGVLKSKTLIVDATHTKAKYNQKSTSTVLLERAKLLRKEVYRVKENYKENFPKKFVGGNLEETIKYCKEVSSVVEADEELKMFAKIQERLNYLNEATEDNLEELKLSRDEDARIGHKTTDSSFFGYKTHIAMSDERIITGVTVTTGEKTDGKELIKLIEKSVKSGMTIDEVLGDAAYSGKDNIKYTKEKDILLIAKLNPAVSKGNRKKEDEFEFNKDANMYVCPEGHLAIKKAKQGKKNMNKNQTTTYYFNVEKCRVCPRKEGCYKEGSKSKSYSVTIKSDLHKEQMEFEKTEYFKERAKERYKIEAKNSEIKHRHGYDVATSSGLIGMQLQGALTMFTVNIKRIIALKG